MARARRLSPHSGRTEFLCMSILVAYCRAAPDRGNADNNCGGADCLAAGGVQRRIDDSNLLQMHAVPMTALNASAAVMIEKDRTHARFHTGSIGMPSQPWLPVSMEFELWGDAETTTKVKDDVNSAALLKTAVVVKYSLDHAHARPSTINESQWAHMRSLHIKEGHDARELHSHWNWERENSRGMLELATPVNLTEEQVIFAMNVVDHASFTRMFQPGDAFHVHVDGQCLKKDEKRLIGLLLMWEQYHDHILKLTNSRRKGIRAYASKIVDKSPDLLAMLQQRFLSENTKEQEPLEDAFTRLESTMKSGRDRKLAMSPSRTRDGFRDFAVNVCHLLNVTCCQDCNKNKVPKFGAVEFRVFDAAFAPSVLLTSVAERLVQQACSAPLESMKPLLALPGVPEPEDVTELLSFLQLDSAEFAAAFPKGRTVSRVPEPVNMLKQYQTSQRHRHGPYHRGSIGLPDKPWLQVSVELELWGDDELTSKVKKMNNTALLQSGRVVQDVLANLHSSEESSEQSGGVVSLARKGTARTTFHVKEGHDALDDLNAWNWERENNRGMLELASPCNLTEDEARYAVELFDDPHFRRHFYPGDAFHVHVDSHCLLEDGGDKRLVGLLLMWEHFYDAILDMTNSRRKGIPSYAAKIGEKNPPLLEMLQERWMANETKETLSHAFARLESSIRDGRDSDLPLAPRTHRDGYRDMAVNVCHLLDVHCCHDCDKNLVPKFGALEFRVFDAAFAESILFIAMTQRLVQTTCSVPVEEMEHLLELPSASPAEDATPFLEFLQLDVAEFRKAFLHSASQSSHVKTKKAHTSVRGTTASSASSTPLASRRTNSSSLSTSSRKKHGAKHSAKHSATKA